MEKEKDKNTLIASNIISMLPKIFSPLRPTVRSFMRITNWGALREAIEADDIKKVKEVLDNSRFTHGVDIEEPTKEGITPLSLAISKGNKKIIKLLTEYEDRLDWGKPHPRRRYNDKGELIIQVYNKGRNEWVTWPSHTKVKEEDKNEGDK